MDIKIPQITWFNNGEKTSEELDKLSLQRFNIKNLKDLKDYNLNNFYIFKVMDMNTDSTTGYYGMCINKEYTKQMQAMADAIKNNIKK